MTDNASWAVSIAIIFAGISFVATNVAWANALGFVSQACAG